MKIPWVPLTVAATLVAIVVFLFNSMDSGPKVFGAPGLERLADLDGVETEVSVAPDGSRLYAGGTFRNARGRDRRGLVALWPGGADCAPLPRGALDSSFAAEALRSPSPSFSLRTSRTTRYLTRA